MDVQSDAQVFGQSIPPRVGDSLRILREREPDLRTLARRAGELHAPAQLLDPVAHVLQAVRPWSAPSGIKTAPIVFHHHQQQTILEADSQSDFSGLGMTHHIVESFLEGEKQTHSS